MLQSHDEGIYGRVFPHTVTHIFRDGKSRCGIWYEHYLTKIIPGTENPICKRCLRSVYSERNKAKSG